MPRHYEGQACRDIPQRACLITREPEQEAASRTMSSVAEPLNDRGADGLNEELTASANCPAIKR